MNRLVIRLVIAIVILPLLVIAQQASKPYAGEQARRIKALSDEEIKAYLNGEGMGLAKAAELNSYPGPRHGLELRARLELTPAQTAATERAYQKMHGEATRLGRRIDAKEHELNALFAGKQIDENRLRALTGEIASLQGSLRAAHLGAHLEVRRILSVEQVKKYDELRGYQSTHDAPANQQHHHHAKP